VDLPRPPRLTLRFAIYAGVALAVAGGASVWVANWRATVTEQREVWSDARFVAERLGKDDLARSALERPVFGDQRAELDELFDREALGPEAKRITLFRRDGRVTYSTDHTLIGTIHARPATIEAALAGEAVYGVAGAGGDKVLESYVPVRWVLADPGWAAGVLRISRDYAPVAEEIRDTTRIQAVTILLALLLLYLALFPILGRVTNTLAERTRSLEESEARWRAITEQASDAIFVVDDEGVVLQANERACWLLDRSLEDIVDRSFGDFVDADDLARVPLQLDRLKEGETVFVERRLRRPDGTLLVADLSSRMLDDGRILAIVRDVTERTELEEQRRRALRAEATERLAAGIAHDFDRLLAGVAAHAEVALGRISPSDGLRIPLEQVRNAAARGVELTRQLLAFGTRADGEAQVIDLTEMFDRIEGRVRQVAGAHVQVVTDLAQDLWHISADPDELEELVATLAVNACDSMPEGGTLTVAAANVDFTRRKRPADEDSRVEPGHYVMLAITDTGPGRGRALDRRLGVGLAAAFALVQRTGGTLGVESEPGLGTTVRVYLPRVDAPAVSALPEPEQPVDVRGTETVLIAEDERIVRTVVREMLGDLGYRVLEAASGREALELVAAHDGTIDLLLTDMVMPDLGGAELARELGRTHPECAVVFMSGHAAGAPEPGFAFLQKPFTHESLAHTVRRVLDEAREAAA